MPRPLKPIEYIISDEPVPAGRPGVPNPIDVHLGIRIRARRVALGISQQKLGELLGLTFQQIQKYERGANRVGASRLWDLSRVLETPISFFFEDMPEKVRKHSPRLRAGLKPEPAPYSGPDADPEANQETLELAQAYYRIKDPAVRKRVFDLIKAQAKVLGGV